MTLQYSPKNNPRVIVIQKLYGKYFNKEENLTFPKHRFKKFIKDIVNGTIERNDLISSPVTDENNIPVENSFSPRSENSNSHINSHQCYLLAF